MNDAPEKIWAWGEPTIYCATLRPTNRQNLTEYIRSDLIQPMIDAAYERAADLVTYTKAGMIDCNVPVSFRAAIRALKGSTT